MKIEFLTIENFRAVQDFEGSIDKFTSFIGPNGGGKSTILRAIGWLFDGSPMLDEDFFQDALDGTRADEMKVQVTFSELTETDRSRFGRFARGDSMTLMRTQNRGSSSQLLGSLKVAPEFEEIRDESVKRIRQRLIELKEGDPRFESLPETGQIAETGRTDLREVMNGWEDQACNRKYLVDTGVEPAADIAKELEEYPGFIFLPAAQDLTGEFNLTNRKSAMERLLGALMKSTVEDSVASWTTENAALLAELETRVKTAARNELNARSSAVNQHLSKYLPGATVNLDVALDDWVPKATPVATSELKKEGVSWPLSRQGHGVQRAAHLAVLQGLADISSGQEAEQSTELIICIEEPEVFQHPVQARTMASAFQQAARRGQMQFIIATHSPYFVDGNHLDSTYRVVPDSQGSRIYKADETAYYRNKNQNGELNKYYSKAMVEGLFSRGCLLVEGETDKAVFEAVKNPKSSLTLSEAGITVVDVEGATNLLSAAALLKSYRVPCYLVRDGDSDREVAEWRVRQSGKAKNHDDFLERVDNLLKRWEKEVDDFIKLAAENTADSKIKDYKWGSGSYVGNECAILNHDLESELNNWAEFKDGSEKFRASEDLRSKKRAGAYARIVEECGSEGVPSVLVDIVEAATDLATGQVDELSSGI